MTQLSKVKIKVKQRRGILIARKMRRIGMDSQARVKSTIKNGPPTSKLNGRNFSNSKPKRQSKEPKKLSGEQMSLQHRLVKLKTNIRRGASLTLPALMPNSSTSLLRKERGQIKKDL